MSADAPTGLREALLTIDEAARRLRVSPSTVRRMLLDRRLRAVRLRGPGSTVRIPARELRRLLDVEGGEQA